MWTFVCVCLLECCLVWDLIFNVFGTYALEALSFALVNRQHIQRFWWIHLNWLDGLLTYFFTESSACFTSDFLHPSAFTSDLLISTSKLLILHVYCYVGRFTSKFQSSSLAHTSIFTSFPHQIFSSGLLCRRASSLLRPSRW